MIVDNTCPGCGAAVAPTSPDPLNDGGLDNGIVVTFRRDAEGADVAQRWHHGCRDSEWRRSQRRGAVAPEPEQEFEPSADLLDAVREALR